MYIIYIVIEIISIDKREEREREKEGEERVFAISEDCQYKPVCVDKYPTSWQLAG